MKDIYNKELSIETQIRVLKKAKFFLLIDKKRSEKNKSSYLYSRGLCSYISKALKCYNVFPETIYYYIYIPLFNRENAIKYANAIQSKDIEYWWNKLNYKDRLYFLNWMINELELELMLIYYYE